MKKFGLIGMNIEKSLSPMIHSRFMNEFNIDASYEIIDTNSVEKAFEIAKQKNLVGFNVTIPYKQEIIKLLDDVTPDVKNIGAVNTVLNQDGKYVGYNTDSDGFIMSLKNAGASLRDKSVSINSAGGVARAIAYSCLKNGCSNLIITGRNHEQRNRLHMDMKEIFQDKYIVSFEENYGLVADMIVNTTPLGSFDNKDLSINLDSVTVDEVFDAAYNTELTPLLKMAKSMNKKYYDGIDMLLAQASISQKIWNNIDIPIEILKELKGEICKF